MGCHGLVTQRTQLWGLSFTNDGLVSAVATVEGFGECGFCGPRSVLCAEMNLSVIIPSKTVGNLQDCVAAVDRHDREVRVIVVDDGVYWDGSPVGFQAGDLIVQGAHPFVFARNVNLGIAAAGSDDVVILNDDALLETPGGFSLLQKTAQEHPEYGLIASTCNNVGNRNQWRRKAYESGTQEHPENCNCGTCGPGRRTVVFGHHDLSAGLREEPRMVCFVCVLIPRRTIDKVGLLDTRFVGYGLDDDDYSLRVLQAGLKIGIHDGCYVDHGSLTSSYRGDPKAPSDFRPNLKLFIEKYGVDNWGKSKPNSQFPELFPA